MSSPSSRSNEVRGLRDGVECAVACIRAFSVTKERGTSRVRDVGWDCVRVRLKACVCTQVCVSLCVMGQGQSLRLVWKHPNVCGKSRKVYLEATLWL